MLEPPRKLAGRKRALRTVLAVRTAQVLAALKVPAEAPAQASA